jgi:rhodanese-related sulfurtransferase
MSSRRLIDVRQPAEFAAGHIDGAELVPLHRLSRACEGWDRKQPITLICLSGHRAQIAYRQLSAQGFEDLYILPGGVRQWRAAGRPLKKLPQSAGARIKTWGLRLGILAVFGALAYFYSPWILIVPGILLARWIMNG